MPKSTLPKSGKKKDDDTPRPDEPVGLPGDSEAPAGAVESCGDPDGRGHTSRGQRGQVLEE